MISTLQRGNPIQTSEGFETSSSTIVASPEIKRLLRSGVYTNKILAVIRETITNAYDAHFQAGTPDKVIKIQLPSLENPVFKVKDEGVGLDDDGVRNILFSYGAPKDKENSKTDSNGYHGAFHIGAKAPFAYVDVFEVVAIEDGIKRIYSAYIDDMQDDRIALTGQEETSEHNGVEVSVTIKQKDIYIFKETVARFLKFWNTPVEITGVDNFYIDKPEWSYEGDKWGILSGRHLNSYIVMSGVTYRVSRESLGQLEDADQTLFNETLVLFCDIGDIGVASGREEVEYTEKTLGYIKRRLAKIRDELTEGISKKSAFVKNEYEARCLFTEMHQTSFTKLCFKLYYPKGYVYDGRDINSKFFTLNNALVSCKRYDPHYGSRRKWYTEKTLNIGDIQDGIYYCLDTDMSEFIMKRRIKHQSGKGSYRDLYILTFENEEDKDFFFEYTGIPKDKVTNVMTLPDVPKAVRSYSSTSPKAPKEKTYENSRLFGNNTFTHNLKYHTYLDCKIGKVSLKEHSGLYVTYHKSEFYVGESPVSTGFLKSAAELLGTTIYAFNKSRALSVRKRYKKQWNALKFGDIRRALEANVSEHNKSLIIEPYMSKTTKPDYLNLMASSIRGGKLSIAESNPISKWIKLVDAQKQDRKEVSQYGNLAKYFCMTYQLDHSDTDAFYKDLNIELVKFPLINAIPSWHVLSLVDQVLDYVCWQDSEYKRITKQ